MSEFDQRPDVGTIWISALRATAEVARRAGTSEADLLRAVAEELRRLRLRGGIALLQPDGQLKVMNRSLSASLERSLYKLTGHEITGYRFNPADVSIYSEALTTGQPVFSDDRSAVVAQLVPGPLKALVPRIMHMLGPANVIVAPLILSDQPIGTFNVIGRWLIEDDTAIVGAMADHIAISIGQVRAQKETKRALELQRLRNQVAEDLASNLELPVMLERVIQFGMQVTEADAASIALLDPQREHATTSYSIGLPEKLRQQTFPRGKGVFWRVDESRKAIVVSDYAAESQALPEWVKAGVRGVLGIPLIAGDDVIGALAMFTLNRPPDFSQAQIEQAQAIASMAALAVRNARLYAQATRRAEESQVLIHTARSISSSLDLDTVLHDIAEQANSLLHADGSRIHLADFESGEIRCVVASEPNAEAIMAFPLKIGEGLTGWVIEHGEPIIINDPKHDERSIQVPGTPEDEPECLAIVPLAVRKRTMGSMTVRRLGLGNPFTQSELDLLTAFAAQAAISIENAHLYGQIEAQARHLEVEVEARTHDLALSESRYRSLVETAQAGIFQCDTKGNLVYVNRAFATMLELPLEALIGKNVREIQGLTPDSYQLASKRLDERVAGERRPREVYEVEFLSSSGKRISALVGISLFSDDSGKPQGITGLVTDISQRIALEEALKAERDRLNITLTHVGDAVVVASPEGEIEYVNPAWERLNGYTAEETIGKSTSILKSGAQDSAYYADMWHTINAGETWQGEIVNRRKDGSLYDAALTITPVVGPEGDVLSFVGVLHDISALKEIDRLKSQFVSDVSHELRTPLTNIRLYLDLLDKIRDQNKVERYLETLSRESDRLANLIDDLLSLSRMDSGAVDVQLSPVKINGLLQSLAKDRRSLAKKQGLSLQTELEVSLPQTLGDERLLGQVFTNLLTNAMNYTPEGGRIVLRTRLVEDDGQAWVVADVEDTGLGIPQEEQSQIFKRFFRGKASRITGAPGTGLGLAICSEIAQRHDGKITLHSSGEPGEGTRFSVWLPAMTPEP